MTLRVEGHIRLARGFVAVAIAGLSVLVPAGACGQTAEGPIEELVVTATRLERDVMKVPAAVTVQDMEDLRRQGFTYGTDEFRGVPGVFFRRGEGDGDEFPFVVFRGITGNHGNDTFLALIDGIPFVGPDEEVFLYEVPYPAVERVEIVRGPVSALYGRGAIAGAVNYVTKQLGQDNRVDLDLAGGDDNFFRGALTLERQVGEGGVLLSAAYEDYDGWRDNSQRQLGNVFAKLEQPIGERSRVTGWLNWMNRDADVPSTIPTLADGTIVDVVGGIDAFLGYRPTRNDVDGVIAAARWETRFSDDFGIAFTGQARRFDTDVRLNFYDFFEFDPADDVFGVNGFASENEATIYFAEAVFDWHGGRHALVGGVSVEQAELEEQDRWSGQNGFSFDCGFTFYAIRVDYTTGDIVNLDDPCFVREELRTDADTRNRFFGAFLQDEIALTDSLTLTLGGRFDAFERDVDYAVVGAQPTDQDASGDASEFSPKAALTFDYGDGIVYASYGHGFNSNFGPVFQWEPDRYTRDERPTTIDSYELGWKGRALEDRLSWEAAAFWLEQKDRRIFVSNPDPSGPPTLATTGQRYESRGVELALQARPGDRTLLGLTYTWLDPEWKELEIESFTGVLDLSGTTPQGVPSNIVFATVEHRFAPWLTGKATWEWYDDYEVTASNNQPRFGQYDLLNLTASFTLPLAWESTIDVTVLNALDEDYFFYFGGSRTAITNVTPGPPRQFRVTFRTSLGAR